MNCWNIFQKADKWQRTAEGLKAWVDEDVTSNQTIWDMEFRGPLIRREALIRRRHPWRRCGGCGKTGAGSRSILRETVKAGKTGPRSLAS